MFRSLKREQRSFLHSSLTALNAGPPTISYVGNSNGYDTVGARVNGTLDGRRRDCRNDHSLPKKRQNGEEEDNTYHNFLTESEWGEY